MKNKEALERLYLGLDDHPTLTKCYDTLFKDLEQLDKYKKAIEILKDTIILPMENDIARVDINGNNHYLLSFIKRLINEQEYELLEEVFDNGI